MFNSRSTLLWLLQIGAFLSVTGLVLVWALYLRRVCHRFHQQFREQTNERLSRAFIFVDPGRLFVLNLTLVALCFLIVLWCTARVDLALLAMLAAGCLPALTLHRIELRRRRRIAVQLPESLMMLASSLRSGASLGVALGHLAHQLSPPLSHELQVMQRERRLGVSLDDSLWNLQRRAPSEGMYLFTCLIRVSHVNGGRLADSLSTLANVCRRSLLLNAKLAALTSQGRLQANVMTLIPLLVAAVLWVMEPELMSQLLTTRPGLAVSTLTVVLLSVGAWMVRRIGRAR